MSSGAGPSGRSPFPGNRSRRRLSAAASEMDESSANSSFASPLVMGNLLSTSRLSPAAASGWSPMSNNTSSRGRPRRFFESDKKQASADGGVLATGIPSASMGAGGASQKSASNGQHHNHEHDSNNTTTDTDEVLDGMNLSQIRSMARNAFQSSTSTALPGMGVFFASILYAKTQSSEDAYLYAQALAANGEAMRSVRILERAGLLSTASTTSLEQRLEAVLLAAQSLASMGEWSEALTLLESATQQGPSSVLEDDDDSGWQALVHSVQTTDQTTLHPVARLCLLRGRAYNETSNPTRAALYWKRALRIDPNCHEALNLLFHCNMLTPDEAHELISSLEMEQEWLRNLYLARVSVPPEETDEQRVAPTTPSFAVNGLQGVDASSIQMATPSMMQTDENNQKMPAKASIQRDVTTAFEQLWTKHKLEKAPEALSLAAVRSYRQYDLKSALEYCKELTAIDPLCPTASFVYVATLLALDCKRLLFQLAHEWVEAFPKSAHAWFAVGSYYYACGRYHVAQRHFCRATRLDPQCTEAWIAFGCSFAMSDETDQALASFRAAQRLAPAHHVPLLYMGMEYLRTNHLVLARHFLMAANKTSGGDPLCLHELGVADYQRKEYATAAVWFQRSLAASAYGAATDDPVELCQDVFWEPTLFNLGQCYRKSRQFTEAARCFEKCLSLCPVRIVI